MKMPRYPDRPTFGKGVIPMAERRMFAKSVINSARFLRMPQTSRLLYYDLGMSADDDGVVEAFTVIRTTGAAEDDLRVLATRGFITVLNDDLVSYITDWSRNNYIQKDRYRPSIYNKLLVKLGDGNQSATDWQPSGDVTDTVCIQPVSNMDTQVRLGKDSIGKGSVVADKPPTRPRFVPPTLEEVTAYVQERGSKVDPQGFIDFYASKGWLVGKTPMKDWKAACRNAEHWERWGKPQSADRNRLRTDADYMGGGDFFGGGD